MIDKIKRLRRERNAVILAHNYQLPEVQDVADYVGDSLGLSIQASRTDAEVIVFCGVHFMAETAALICPDKLVLEPHENAGCLMSDMITVRQLREWKDRHPDAAVVCYVNSTAGIKAESDVCCTSANSVKVVQSIPEDRPILFVPDKSLGAWTAKESGREMMLWEGYCPTHHRILAGDIRRARAAHPDAVVIVHPECTAEAIAEADEVFSTGGMCRYATESDAREMIMGTEIGLLHRLKKENPGKFFYPVTDLAWCLNMKLNTLEKLLWALEDSIYQVKIPEELAERARLPIERMLRL
ncbi:MAG: quinolinate synthase NadA [Candidatus Latescibacterota bacterium]